ncbi:MAG: hypothetical protein ACE5H4_15905 [Candidatus Thorarchaeota archaeon]
MSAETIGGELDTTTQFRHSRLTTVLYIYLQGLVVAVFGALFYIVFLWLPISHKTLGALIMFWVVFYLLGAVNNRISKRFWFLDYEFSVLTILGQGAILLLLSVIVLSGATTVFTIHMVGGPQIDPVFQIQLGIAATLIAPPFYGLLARDVTSWRIGPSDRRSRGRRSSW